MRRRVPRINLPWDIDAADLERQLGLHQVTLVNDVEANARGILGLGEGDFAVLQTGAPEGAGTCAVVSAGTGLGEAALWWDGTKHHPAAGEGGSAAFGPSSQLEIDFHRFLAAERGRVNWGPRSRRLTENRSPVPPSTLFVSIYGARAGDVALSYGATGGVYLGGGIAPKLLPRLLEGGFMRAFLAKGRLESFVRRVPVRVVLNTDAAVIRAALIARDSVTLERAAA